MTAQTTPPANAVAGTAVAGTAVNTIPGPTRRALDWCAGHAGVIAAGAVLLNLAVTVGYSLVLGSELRYLDERDYVALAAAVADGHGYSVNGAGPTGYRPPGYPLLLAPVHLLSGGSVPAMRLVGVVALACSVWLAYLLGRRAHSALAGAVAAVLMAGYPLLGYTATALYPQVPALLLLLLFLELTFRAMDVGPGRSGRRRWTLAAGAGLAAGWLILTVPSFAPSVPLVVGWLAWRRRQSVSETAGPETCPETACSRRVVLGVVAVLLAAATMLPLAWCARNAVLIGTFAISTNNGVNLLLGNHPGAGPGSGAGADLTAYHEHFAGREPTEVELDQFYRDQAIDWITSHPGNAVLLYAGKVAHTFSYRDELATGEQANPVQDLISALSFYPVLALAVLRLLAGLRLPAGLKLPAVRRRPLSEVEWLTVILIVVNVLLLAVFFTRLRLRMPLDGLTILLAASAVALPVQHWLSRRGGTRREAAQPERTHG